MEKIEFRSCDIKFDLSIMIRVVIFKRIKKAIAESRLDEYVRFLGIITLREFIESQYDNFPELGIGCEKYIDFLDDEILNIIKESFSKKYIGFYKDNLKNKIYNFDNLPILLEEVDKSIKKNIGFPYDVSLYFEKV